MTESNSGGAGLAHTKLCWVSANPFEFFHVLRPDKMDKLAAQAMSGDLYMPPGSESSDSSSPCPAIVQLHGSNGWADHHNKHRDALVRKGFAVLQVNSFADRGVTSTAERQIAVTMATLVNDAFTALHALRAQPGIDGGSIGLAGWSLGGGAANYAALEAVIAALGKGKPGFACLLAYYPGLNYKPVGDWQWSSAPILSQVGGLDDWTPAAKLVLPHDRPVQQPGSQRQCDSLPRQPPLVRR